MNDLNKERRPKGSGTTIKRRGGYYCRWRVDGADVTRKPTHKPRPASEHEAGLVLARVEDHLADGVELSQAIRMALGQPEPVEATLADLADRYLDSLVGIRSPENLMRERWTAGAFNSHFKGIDPARLEPAGVAQWAEKLGRTRSPKTVNRHLSFASKTWRWGQQHGYAPADRNPFRLIDRAPEVPVERITFTKTELAAILAQLPGEIADYALAQVQTAWRPRELEALTWANLEDGVLSIAAGEEKRRKAAKRIVLSSRLNASLEGCRGLPKPLIFSHPRGRPWNSKTRGLRFSHALEAAIKANDVAAHKASATWYELKHSALTVMLASGVSPAVVSQMSGVSIGTIMKHYAGAMQDAQRDALRIVWGE